MTGSRFLLVRGSAACSDQTIAENDSDPTQDRGLTWVWLFRTATSGGQHRIRIGERQFSSDCSNHAQAARFLFPLSRAGNSGFYPFLACRALLCFPHFQATMLCSFNQFMFGRFGGGQFVIPFLKCSGGSRGITRTGHEQTLFLSCACLARPLGPVPLSSVRI